MTHIICNTGSRPQQELPLLHVSCSYDVWHFSTVSSCHATLFRSLFLTVKAKNHPLFSSGYSNPEDNVHGRYDWGVIWKLSPFELCSSPLCFWIIILWEPLMSLIALTPALISAPPSHPPPPSLCLLSFLLTVTECISLEDEVIVFLTPLKLKQCRGGTQFLWQRWFVPVCVCVRERVTGFFWTSKMMPKPPCWVK